MDPQPDGCIYFTGAVGADGYAKIRATGRLVFAHRAAYEYFVGRIAPGMTVDHLCHNEDPSCAGGPSCLHRRCVNWEHLREATQRENILASPNSIAGRNLRRYGKVGAPC